MPMNKLLTIISIFILSQSACFANETPDYVVSSDCVTSIEIQPSKYYNPGWSLVIYLNETTANQLLSYSKDNIGLKVRFVNGNGKEIIKDDVVIRSEISSPFLLSGLMTEQEAENAKKSISSSKGQCGIK